MAMGDFSPNWQEAFANYALTPRDALGASTLYMRSDDESKSRQLVDVTYTRLLERWTDRQQRELDHAVQSGAWQNAAWLQREHAFMLPQSSFWQDGADRLTAREQAMGMIDDFSQLRMPFLEPKRTRKPKVNSSLAE